MEYEVRTYVGARVKTLRLEQGMSQGDLAEGIGMVRTSITNIEVGRQRLLVPSFINIALVLGVEMANLLPTWEDVGAILTPGHEKELRSIERQLARLGPTMDRIQALVERHRELSGG